mmetsp:Transcript_48737/g.143843  ORF Transcript_48737/g.143843 Transcript_48737/m.143843 type:complete len:336 (+) Transcript_48737:2694-3701(+)
MVPVELLEHGARVVRTPAARAHGEADPLLNADLDLGARGALRGPPGLEEAHGVGLECRGPAVHDLVPHRGVHLGREAGVHGEEKREQVRAVGAAHEGGARRAPHELHLHVLDGLVVPVQLGQEAAHLVEPRDVGVRGASLLAAADAVHEDAAIEVLPALEVAQAQALEGVGDEGLRRPVPDRHEHLLAEQGSLDEGGRQHGLQRRALHKRRDERRQGLQAPGCDLSPPLALGVALVGELLPHEVEHRPPEALVLFRRQRLALRDELGRHLAVARQRKGLLEAAQASEVGQLPLAPLRHRGSRGAQRGAPGGRDGLEIQALWRTVQRSPALSRPST